MTAAHTHRGSRRSDASRAVVIEDGIEIPMDLAELSAFRRWALSDTFPDRGRIDYINGSIEVDMSPEDLFTHGSVKGEVSRALSTRVKVRRLGYLFIDSARVSSDEGQVSAEPDVVFVSRRSVESEGVRLVAKASGEADRYVEIEGSPDLVVEVISDASVGKDTRRLPTAYFKAGVQEYWLVDARKDDLVFHIHRRGNTGFEAVAVDADGWQHSDVMQVDYKLTRQRDELGLWMYDLLERGE